MTGQGSCRSRGPQLPHHVCRDAPNNDDGWYLHHIDTRVNYNHYCHLETLDICPGNYQKHRSTRQNDDYCHHD